MGFCSRTRIFNPPYFISYDFSTLDIWVYNYSMSSGFVFDALREAQLQACRLRGWLYSPCVSGDGWSIWVEGEVEEGIQFNYGL